MNQKMTIWIYMIKKSGGINPATVTFCKSNKTFSVSQTPSVSSSKVDDTEGELPKRKEFLGIVLLMYRYPT